MIVRPCSCLHDPLDQPAIRYQVVTCENTELHEELEALGIVLLALRGSGSRQRSGG
jgi:hypothetical protein